MTTVIYRLRGSRRPLFKVTLTAETDYRFSDMFPCVSLLPPTEPKPMHSYQYTSFVSVLTNIDHFVPKNIIIKENMYLKTETNSFSQCTSLIVRLQTSSRPQNKLHYIHALQLT